MTKSKFVYVTYISATPEQVWKALLDREFTRQSPRAADADLDSGRGASEGRAATKLSGL
jgi:hypothetical protein